MVADVFLDGVAKAKIEAAEINADDNAGFSLNRESEELVEETSEFEIVFEDIGDAGDSVLGEVEGQINSCRCHFRPARSEKFCVRQFFAQGGNQFRGEQITARLASDEHESFGFHCSILEG